MQNLKANMTNTAYNAVHPIEVDDLGQTPPVNRRRRLGHKVHLERNSTIKHNGFSELTTKIWPLEWLSWLLAAASISGIVIILARFDRHPVAEWPYSITLGALVSLLATIATIGLTEPVAAGIGQTKWTWHAKPRTMIDFHLIDEASRGPLKAIWLICSAKGGVLANCGAVLAVTILAVNPFTQQVVRLDSSNGTSTNTAKVPIATGWDDSGAPGQSGILLDPDLSMKAAIQRGLLDVNANASTFLTTPECPSGNCTWPSYSTLAVCSRCTDISSLLTTTEPEHLTMNASLPNGMSIYGNLGITVEGEIAMVTNVTNGMTTPLDSLAFAEWSQPLADVITIILPYAWDNERDHLQGPYASECILQLCVQSFTASSVKGVFSEIMIGNPVYVNNTLETDSGDPLSISGTNYTIEWNTAKGLELYFADNYNTEVQQSNGLSPVNKWPDSGVAQSIFYWTNSSTDHLPTQVFENIASSMSLKIRQASNLTAVGMSLTTDTIFIIRWGWMALPFTLLILVALYLGTVIWVTDRSKFEPWKTSSLPILMHGLADDESRDIVGGLATLSQMESVAKTVKMKAVAQYNTSASGVKDLGLTLVEKASSIPSQSSSS